MLGVAHFLEVSSLYIFTFLVNYFIHSSIFIILVLACLKLEWLKADARGETVLKATLFMGLLSSILLNFRPVSVDTSWQLVATPPVPINSVLPPTSEARLLTQFFPGDPQFVSDVPLKTGQPEHQLSDSLNVYPLEHGSQTSVAPVSQSENNFDFARFSVLSMWIVLYWLCGVILMLAIRLYQHYQVAQLMKQKKLLQDVMLLSGLASLKSAANYAGDIRLYSSTLLNSPIVLNQKEIVLPEIFVTRYSSHQQQAALAHELAHIKRNDVFWQKVFILFDVLFFFQPLHRILRKKLYQVVEQRADDVASNWTGNPRALAEALSVTAEQQLGNPHARWVLAMKCEKSDLLLRVENLLHSGIQKTRGSAVSAILLATFTLILFAPGVSLSVSAMVASPSQNSGETDVDTVSLSTSGEHLWSYAAIDEEDGPIQMSITSIDDDNYWKLTADLQGMPEFNEAENQITYFPPESEFEVKINDGSNKRRLTVSRHQGEIEYLYYVNRQRKEITDDAQWFADFIPELLRKTGWYAQQRIARMLNAGGVNTVLDEVRQITGDEVKSRYLFLLPRMHQLTPEDIDQVIVISGTIHSDYSKAKTLVSLLQNASFEERNYRNLIANINDIESDVEMAKVMHSAFMSAPSESDTWHDLLNVAENIQSDYELSKLLSELVMQRAIQEHALSALFRVAITIQSDHELAKLLIVIAEKVPLSSKIIIAFLDTAQSIQSDFEMRKALSMLLNNNVQVNDVLQVIDVAKAQIQSDNELANLFLDLIRSRDMSPGVRDEVYDSLDAIHSDNEKLRVLRVLRQH